MARNVPRLCPPHSVEMSEGPATPPARASRSGHAPSGQPMLYGTGSGQQQLTRSLPCFDDAGVMADGPAILARVWELLERQSPQCLCDDCITETLDLSWPSRANRAARELSQRDSFERLSGTCAVCGRHRVVIARVAN
jgi:hypothetical protein